MFLISNLFSHDYLYYSYLCRQSSYISFHLFLFLFMSTVILNILLFIFILIYFDSCQKVEPVEAELGERQRLLYHRNGDRV